MVSYFYDVYLHCKLRIWVNCQATITALTTSSCFQQQLFGTVTFFQKFPDRAQIPPPYIGSPVNKKIKKHSHGEDIVKSRYLPYLNSFTFFFRIFRSSVMFSALTIHDQRQRHQTTNIRIIFFFSDSSSMTTQVLLRLFYNHFVACILTNRLLYCNADRLKYFIDIWPIS